MNLVISKPKTKAEALARMTTLIATEAGAQGEPAPGEVNKHFILAAHWMFRPCRDEAIANGWPLKNGDHLTWTAGDTVGRFLDQLSLPDY